MDGCAGLRRSPGWPNERQCGNESELTLGVSPQPSTATAPMNVLPGMSGVNLHTLGKQGCKIFTENLLSLLPFDMRWAGFLLYNCYVVLCLYVMSNDTFCFHTIKCRIMPA